MQVKVEANLDEALVLPLGYHHILQSIVYRNLMDSPEYSSYLHNEGYENGKRQFKMFTFGPLRGKYLIRDKEISFLDKVQFEVRSPEVMMVRTLEDSIRRRGLFFGERHLASVHTTLADETVERNQIQIRMQSPVTVRMTDPISKKTHFYYPGEPEFFFMICENFKRKYKAYYGVEPKSEIAISPIKVSDRDKYVTRYKNFMISGWLGEYKLEGERKYLDFLYQTGLGEKNAQGFGMFDVINKSEGAI